MSDDDILRAGIDHDHEDPFYPWEHPTLFSLPDNEYEYDDRTLHAERLYAEACAEERLVRGTPKAWVVYKRSTSLGRILDARAEGIHLLHRWHDRGRNCTCGLVVPYSYDNPLHAPGHLSSHATHTVTLLLGITTPTSPSAVADRRYGVCCQQCGWDSHLAPLAEARRILQDHQH